jgi:hypothetical protein
MNPFIHMSPATGQGIRLRILPQSPFFSLRALATSARTLCLPALVCLCACAPVEQLSAPLGFSNCERFFIYDLCLSDLDEDGDVDFMYFDDTKEIFMYAATALEEVSSVMPLHECAIPMSTDIRSQSSQLLYGDSLPLSERLAVKGRLINSYRKAQPAISACNRAQSDREAPSVDDPFLVQEDWPDDAL